MFQHIQNRLFRADARLWPTLVAWQERPNASADAAQKTEQQKTIEDLGKVIDRLKKERDELKGLDNPPEGTAEKIEQLTADIINLERDFEDIRKETGASKQKLDRLKAQIEKFNGREKPADGKYESLAQLIIDIDAKYQKLKAIEDQVRKTPSQEAELSRLFMIYLDSSRYLAWKRTVATAKDGGIAASTLNETKTLLEKFETDLDKLHTEVTKETKPEAEKESYVAEAKRLQEYAKGVVEKGREIEDDLRRQGNTEKADAIKAAVDKVAAYQTFDDRVAKEALEGFAKTVNAARDELDKIGISSLSAGLPKPFELQGTTAKPGEPKKAGNPKEIAPEDKNKKYVNVKTTLNVRDGAGNIIGTLKPGAVVTLDDKGGKNVQEFANRPEIAGRKFRMVKDLDTSNFIPNASYKTPASPGDTGQRWIAQDYLSDKPIEGVKGEGKASDGSAGEKAVGGEKGKGTPEEQAKAKAEKEKTKKEEDTVYEFMKSTGDSYYYLGKKGNLHYIAKEEDKDGGYKITEIHTIDASGKDLKDETIEGEKHLATIRSLQTASNTTKEDAKETTWWSPTTEVPGKRISMLVRDSNRKIGRLSYFEGKDGTETKVTAMTEGSVIGTDLKLFPALKKNLTNERATAFKGDFVSSDAVYLGRTQDSASKVSTYHALVLDNGQLTHKEGTFSDEETADPLEPTKKDAGTDIPFADLRAMKVPVVIKGDEVTFKLPSIGDTKKKFTITGTLSADKQTVTITKMEEVTAPPKAGESAEWKKMVTTLNSAAKSINDLKLNGVKATTDEANGGVFIDVGGAARRIKIWPKDANTLGIATTDGKGDYNVNGVEYPASKELQVAYIKAVMDGKGTGNLLTLYQLISAADAYDYRSADGAFTADYAHKGVRYWIMLNQNKEYMVADAGGSYQPLDGTKTKTIDQQKVIDFFKTK